jgi:hypothetical protein
MAVGRRAFNLDQARLFDNRLHHRVKLSLRGRYMREDRCEFDCRTADISPGGMALFGPSRPPIGERLVLHLEYLGRLEGAVVRHFENGFAVSLYATRYKREKLATRLTWLAHRDAGELEDGRRHERMIPRRVEINIRLEDGRSYPARICDLSASGVALLVETVVGVGAMVYVGEHTRGRVVRAFEGGVAIEFLRLVPFELLDEDLEL